MKTYRIASLLVLFAALLLGGCTKSPFKPCDSYLKDGWKIQSSNQLNAGGEQITNQTFNTEAWIETKVPSTVLNSLVQAGKYQDIYRDKNFEKIDAEQFKCSWWYRKEFVVDQKNKEMVNQLVFEGVNYRANIWLNGKKIADTAQIQGAFGIWDLNVSEQINNGINILAIEIFPPKFDDLTIGFVDWNPAPADKNMGLWRGVRLVSSEKVSMEEPFVYSDVDIETLKTAGLSISTKVTNHTKTEQKIELEGVIGDISFKKEVVLNAQESKDVLLTKEEFPQLLISQPKLWWPLHMGEPNLYMLNLTAKSGNMVLDQKEIKFGIRKVEDYINEDGHRGYLVNGKKVLIKGAGWVDDVLLADSDEKVAAQMEYVRHMNMNTVRLEGFWGNNKTLYNKADELGILLMIGWSCHWEWQGYCGRPEDVYMSIRTEHDQEVQARAFADQVKWLRNHPSVFLWVYGSDKLPRPELERKLNQYVKEVDPSRPILASCKYEDFDFARDNSGKITHGYVNISEISGSPAVKMRGPYGYTAPNYWYLDTNAGGAFGFNTETGPGPQVPPFESVKKMISDDYLWPMGEMWDYHSGRNEFSNLKRYLEAFDARYGKAKNAEDFTFRSQISNYEAIRAMFEAFTVSKPKTTGLIQWMLNSAWPEMFWQLYDWYLMPNGAFYGTMKANQPLNLVYNYKDKNIYLTNDYLKSYAHLNASVKVFDINSNPVYKKEIVLAIDENQSKLAIEMPVLKAASNTYFISLSLADSLGNQISDNFYWISTKEDVQDWNKSKWFYTPYKSYADFTSLNTMKKAQVNVDFTNETEGYTCTIENTGNTIAFFIELSIKDKATGETILPVFWSDNYISLLPGEKKVLKARIDSKLTQGKELEFSYKGINIE